MQELGKAGAVGSEPQFLLQVRQSDGGGFAGGSTLHLLPRRVAVQKGGREDLWESAGL